METDDALSALTALSHPSRLAAFRALVQAGPGGLAVGEIREHLTLPPATLSAHLNVLRAAGLVRDAREGRVIRVRADYALMDALVGYLMDNCCGGAAQCAPAACKPPATQVRKPLAGAGAGRPAKATASAASRATTRPGAARKATPRKPPGARR
jgi:ArsR family transcriptional regulator